MQPLTCLSHTVIYSEPSLLVFTGKQLVQFLPGATAVYLCIQETLEML